MSIWIILIILSLTIDWWAWLSHLLFCRVLFQWRLALWKFSVVFSLRESDDHCCRSSDPIPECVSEPLGRRCSAWKPLSLEFGESSSISVTQNLRKCFLRKVLFPSYYSAGNRPKSYYILSYQILSPEWFRAVRPSAFGKVEARDGNVLLAMLPGY